MQTYKFSELTWESLNTLIRLQTRKTAMEKWEQLPVQLNEQEMEQIARLEKTLMPISMIRLNEATVWARAIYPLLMMAEGPDTQAWAQVEMTAQFRGFLLTGTADGVLGRSVLGELEAPFLVIAESKKGIDARDPLYQLLGEMLAAAWLNYHHEHREPQEIFGCYTIAGSWTFLQCLVEGIETETPVMTVESSREFAEKLEAEKILRILKFIAARFKPAEAIVAASGF